MNSIDPRITAFIRKHHVLTLATSVNNMPHCSHLFYAYIPDRACLVFASDESTKHVADALANPVVGGAIVLESKVVGKLQGVQFNGIMRRAKDGSDEKKTYLKKYPFAVAMPLNMWVVELTHIKYTDNTLGFGKKIIWDRDAE